MTENNTRTSKRRSLQGTVVSDKMNKTRVVQVRSSSKHAKYDKIVRMAKKFKAHDEKNESKEGDVVWIMETRPISKDKSWVIREIVKAA
ncbi:MAG: 30S ribosomal protein S17 [Candidatus Omnitrophica bacterium]|nr:30S ribosomal protein S17 [Candidatus Omnitrophota bacterium]